MALNCLPLLGLAAISFAVSLKSFSSDCSGRVSRLSVPFQGAIKNERLDGPSLDQALFPETHQPAETYWPLLAVLSAIRAAVFDSFLLSFACGHICPTGSTGELSSTQAAGQTFAGSSRFTFGVYSAEWMPRSILVLNFTNAKEERKAAGRSFSERDPGGLCNLPYPHGSGIAARDESSLLTVHHKTYSAILCPKLCIRLVCLFGVC